MSKHTPEPWQIGVGDIYATGSDGDDRVVCAIGVSGGFRSHTHELIPSNKPEGRANAARIVACVNACTGMADPQAEIASLRE